MPRLINDDTVASYKQAGLLPRDIPKVAEAKKEPIVVNVTVEQDNSNIDKAIATLVAHSVKDEPKKLEQWEFTVQRDEDGNMYKIIAKQLE